MKGDIAKRRMLTALLTALLVHALVIFGLRFGPARASHDAVHVRSLEIGLVDQSMRQVETPGLRPELAQPLSPTPPQAQTDSAEQDVRWVHSQGQSSWQAIDAARTEQESFAEPEPSATSSAPVPRFSHSTSEAQSGGREKRLDPRSMSTLEQHYVEGWVARIEQLTALNLPQQLLNAGPAQGPTLEVAIAADGALREVRLLRSSGDSNLDQQILGIVQLAAPFTPFPPQLRGQYDILRIPRSWRFLPGDARR